MAATPAEVTEGVTAPIVKKSYAETFKEFLRTAPSKVQKQYILDQLLGSGPGFMDGRDIANRITVAQTDGILSTQDEEHFMKNTLAGKSARTKTRAPKTNGSGRGYHSARVNPLDKVTQYMDEVEAIAQKGMVDPTAINVKDLCDKVILATGAFNGALAAQE